MNSKYIVYQTTNLINNKIYIGVHKTKFPDKFDGYLGNGIWIRKPGTYNKGKTYMQQAVKKYGVENFKRTTLQIFNTADEAYLLEKEIVNEEFLSRDDVYNMVLGGEMQEYKSTKAYQYDLQGNYIGWYTQVQIAAEAVGVNKSSISCAILYKIPIKNYLWTNQYVEKLDLSDFNINPKKSYPVYMYDITGEFIKSFKSCCEAGNHIDCNSYEILRAARLGYLVNKKYQFSFIEDKSYDIAKTRYIQERPVYKYSSSGDFLEEYSHQSDAEKSNPNSNITNCIKSKSLCINGFYWGLEKLNSYNRPSVGNKARSVGVYDLDNNLIEEFITARKCMEKYGKGAQHCLRGDYNTHKGLIFKYLN